MASHFTFIFALALLLVHGTNVKSEDGNPGFSYTGKTGPDNWGTLKKKYEKCRTGKSQSPVDIIVDQAVINKKLATLSTDYTTVDNATVINHKFLTELHLGNAGKFSIDGKDYNLSQIHWHIPSEHRINGVQYAAERHSVHVAADGTRAVIGILYKLGDLDSILSPIENKFAEVGRENGAVLNVGKIEPENLKGKYYRYMGSLTTPPCSEGIIWTILDKVRTISKDQIDILNSSLDPTCRPNFRPVQPLNSRHVEVSSSSFFPSFF